MAQPKLDDRRPALKLIHGIVGRRTTQRKAHAWVYTALVAAVLVLLNVAANRYSWRFDMTGARTFTLAPQTKELLADLPGEVRAIGFFSSQEGGTRGYMEDLLREYQHASRGKLTFTMVDPAENPAMVQQYGVDRSGTTVLVYGEKQEKLDQWDLMGSYDPMGVPQINGEQALTNALLRLTATRTPMVYFLEGHGEKPVADWQRQLRAESFKHESLNFATRTEVPADADAIIIAGPNRDLAQREVDLLDQWLKEKGGRLILMADPGQSLPVLEGWLKGWGVTLNNDVVVDPDRHYLYDVASPVPYYGTHEITSKADAARAAMVIPGARSLALEMNREGFRYDTLLTTSQNSWGETGPLDQDAARDGLDNAGPLTLAAAVTRSGTDGKPDARLVVVGSSAFVSDNALSLQGNLDFAMASLGWLVDRGESVTIRAKEQIQLPMFFTNREAFAIFISTVLVMPLLFLLAGGVVWYRRRHL